jgi:membrane protein
LKKKRSKFSRNILRNARVRKWIRWAKSSSFVGFQGISIFDILLFINNERKKDDIVTRANAISFNFFLAIFPALIFLVAVFSTIPIIKFSDIMDDIGDNILPGAAGDFIYQTFLDLSEIPRGGLVSLGVILALIFASNGMMSLIDGFEKSYEQTFKYRSYWKKRLIALGLTFVVFFLMIISSSLIILSDFIFGYLFDLLDLDNYLRYTIITAKALFALSLLYILIATIYRFGSSLRIKFNFFSPGTNLAAIGSFLTSLGFSYFVNNFGTYNKVYGSIGAIIVMMIYIQINVFILLVGFELNTAIAVNRDLKQIIQDGNTKSE